MKNINDLRNELSDIFEGLRAGRITPKDAVELNNTAGKIVATCKVELAHRILTQDKTPIPFLDTSVTPVKKMVENWNGAKTTHQLKGD